MSTRRERRKERRNVRKKWEKNKEKSLLEQGHVFNGSFYTFRILLPWEVKFLFDSQLSI